MGLINELEKLYSEMLVHYPDGLANTSTTKFNPVKDLLAKKFSVDISKIYICGAGKSSDGKSKPSNLNTRLPQNTRTNVNGTAIGLAYVEDPNNTEDSRIRTTESSIVTIKQLFNNQKIFYDNILIIIVCEKNLYATALLVSNKSSLSNKLEELFITKNIVNVGPSRSPIDNMRRKIKANDNIIYYGPPGTGKTHELQKIFNSYEKESRFMVTFHQSFSYEDFVEGLKPTLIKDNNDRGDVKYLIEDGLFKNACKKAAELAGYSTLVECINDTFEKRQERFETAIKEKKVAIISIDEINRGNVVSIFGELISLIEDSKRLGSCRDTEMIVKLPYSKEKFGVPANLLIVGTMNTADRSIQLLDSAFRRRFRFIELVPDYTVFDNPNGDAANVLRRINNRIRSILNKDNQIGHSYLMHANTSKEIIDVMINKIIPLLEEYFYNDISKVRFVLNENNNTNYPFYIEDTEAKEAYQSYLSIDEVDDEDKSFYTLDEKILKIEDEDECKQYIKHLLGENE